MRNTDRHLRREKMFVTVHPQNTYEVAFPGHMIKYAHNTYDGRTRMIPSEDKLFYFRWRRRTAVSMTSNDGAYLVRSHTLVTDDGVTSLMT